MARYSSAFIWALLALLSYIDYCPGHPHAALCFMYIYYIRLECRQHMISTVSPRSRMVACGNGHLLLTIRTYIYHLLTLLGAPCVPCVPRLFRAG